MVRASGIVATQDGHRVALLLTGRRHAGENLAHVLAAGAPLAVVWVLDAAELISFDEVLAALLSVRVILAATAILGVAAWVERRRRGGARDGAH